MVRFQTFIQAIRDSGYKGTPSAIAELVDNAIEAGASEIRIDLITEPRQDVVTTIRVLDNGEGMTPGVLQTALQFGGSSRFNSRVGLGRYGMGLPCSSLSIAQRVDVWSWRTRRAAWSSCLDVEEISQNGIAAVPNPRRRPRAELRPVTETGTVIELSNCDRLDSSRAPLLERYLRIDLGRIFRHLILKGVVILVNGSPVKPIDPLFLDGDREWSRAKPFGPPLVFPLRVPQTRFTSRVIVRFSELPISDWFDLSNSIKRKLGIAKGAGVSIVRAGREVDYGWFFMGSKRRENYDDWWRCEVHYEPVLDELFGLTHTKQRVRPAGALEEIITPEVEAIARTLNARVRSAFLSIKGDSRLSPSERRARDADVLLEPSSIAAKARQPRSSLASAPQALRGLKYDLSREQLPSSVLFEPKLHAKTLHVTLNTRHPFDEEVYQNVVKQASLRAGDAVRLAACV
ncbi:MAG TPA: ATP-binding protein [Bryobacterales bacterium]|nr:ATP-binding protein [Bryobacterales bacterium]